MNSRYHSRANQSETGTLFLCRSLSIDERSLIRDYFEKHSVNPTMQWDTEEAVIIPGAVPFLNESLCADRPQTYLFTLYKGYGIFAPLKRNPT